jgi:hypothetical protein
MLFDWKWVTALALKVVPMDLLFEGASLLACHPNRKRSKYNDDFGHEPRADTDFAEETGGGRIA